MKKSDIKYVPEKDFRELFTVTVDPIRCTDTCIGITNDGTLLYIEEQMMSSGNAYWMEREFFEIDKEEFCRYLAIAEENGEIAKAVTCAACGILPGSYDSSP